MMMKMKHTLCRISCLVTLVVELSWINVGHSMHREGGNRVSVADALFIYLLKLEEKKPLETD